MRGYFEKTDTQENMYMLRSTDDKNQIIWVNQEDLNEIGCPYTSYHWEMD